MPMNRIQFQPGVSLPDFFARYGSEEQCVAALRAMRWPDGFCCPRCDCAQHCVVGHGARRLFQCQSCRHQTSLTAGTVLDSTKLPLRTWFLAIYLISQDKTGLSLLALMRHLGTSYPTAWQVHHRLMVATAQEALRGIDKARAQADRTRQQVVQQTRTAWLGLTVGAGRIAALSQALLSTQSRLDATRLGRQVGDRTTLDLLNAENDAASIELTLLQARVEFLMNRLRLAAAASRLDDAWLQSVNAALQPSQGR